MVEAHRDHLYHQLKEREREAERIANANLALKDQLRRREGDIEAVDKENHYVVSKIRVLAEEIESGRNRDIANRDEGEGVAIELHKVAEEKGEMAQRLDALGRRYDDYVGSTTQEKRVEAILADERRGTMELKLESVRAVFAEVIRRDTLYAGVLTKIKGVYEQRIRTAVREAQENKSRTACGPLAEEVDALKGKLYRSEVEKT